MATKEWIEKIKSIWIRAPWALATTLLALIGGVYIASNSHNTSNTDDNLPQSPNQTTQKYRGFYVKYNPKEGQERDSKNAYYTTFEDITITKGEPNSWISEGALIARDKDTQTKRYFTGDIIGEYISMTPPPEFGDNENQTSQTGIKAYNLAKRTNEYTGHITYRDSTHQLTLRCPYVLSSNLKLSIKEAQKAYPQLQGICDQAIYDQQK